MELRKVLATKLAELMKKDERIIVLDADLSHAIGTFPLYEQFPNRCYNVGVAEQNMAGIAAGLSAYGFLPMIVTFTPFATRRICDQIAVSIAYAKRKVVILGADPGITAQMNGGTHMSFEDVGIMRSIPTMLIIDIVDEIQLAQAIPQIFAYEGPVYVRMPRKSRPIVFDEQYKFDLNKADVLKVGSDVTLIASGTMVYEAVQALKLLEGLNIDVELINANTIKPLDEETILNSVKKTGKVVVCENHNLIGGLFSAVSELLTKQLPTKAIGVGVKDRFGQVGNYDELLADYEMTPKDIVKAVEKIMYEE